jgi:hypothetical protein
MTMLTEELQKILTEVSSVKKEICYRSEVKTAAKFKNDFVIEKYVCAVVTLFGQPDETTPVYQDLVRQRGSGENAENFEASKKTFFEHDENFYSLIHHKTTGKAYLYCIFDDTLSTDFFVNGSPASREEVAEYLTPSEAKKLLNPPEFVKNVSQDVEHDVIVRTISLENVISIRP